jgi:hypothetical protein
MSDSTDTTGSAATPPEAGPAPLLRMLALPGLPEADGDVPVCGPDGCSVSAAASSEQR